MIVGVTGHMGAGKNEVGKIFEEKGFHQIAFADKVKELALAIDPLVWAGERRGIERLSMIIGREGWDAAKRDTNTPEVRRLLQAIAHEAVRRIIGWNTWVDALRNTIRELSEEGVKNFVITDVRYLNEAAWLQAHVMDAQVWKVIRPLYEGDGHGSETEIDQIEEDVTIHNVGGLDRLREAVLANLEVAVS